MTGWVSHSGKQRIIRYLDNPDDWGRFLIIRKKFEPQYAQITVHQLSKNNGNVALKATFAS